MYANYAPASYQGYYGTEPSADSMIDKVRGWAAMANASDLFAFATAGAVGLYNFFVLDGGLLPSIAWGAIAWGGYRVATALVAGAGLGTEPVFSLGLMGAGAAFLFADDQGWLPGGGFNLFDDFSEDWG